MTTKPRDRHPSALRRGRNPYPPPDARRPLHHPADPRRGAGEHRPHLRGPARRRRPSHPRHRPGGRARGHPHPPRAGLRLRGRRTAGPAPQPPPARRPPGDAGLRRDVERLAARSRPHPLRQGGRAGPGRGGESRRAGGSHRSRAELSPVPEPRLPRALHRRGAVGRQTHRALHLRRRRDDGPVRRRRRRHARPLHHDPQRHGRGRIPHPARRSRRTAGEVRVRRRGCRRREDRPAQRPEGPDVPARRRRPAENLAPAPQIPARRRRPAAGGTGTPRRRGRVGKHREVRRAGAGR